MSIILTLTTLTLTYFHVIRPYLQYRKLIEAREFHEKYHIIQLKWVRKAYPDLQKLSFKEIDERYDVSEAYDRVRLRRGL